MGPGESTQMINATSSSNGHKMKSAADANAKSTKKKPKLDQSDEASSKKKKKKGLAKLNPF